jgi:hypothetical protein
MKTSPSRKGYYSILTTFFFVIVVVAIILSISFFQSQILSFNEANAARTVRYQTVQAVKDTIIGCNDGVVFEEDDLDNGRLKTCLPASTNGVAIDTTSCNGSWQAGNLTGSSYRYTVLVSSNTTCLSTLQIYHGEANP